MQPIEVSDDEDEEPLEELSDSDDSFIVEKVLAEGKLRRSIDNGPKGETRWLLLWTGYGLKDATWESEENISPSIIEEWRESQRDPKPKDPNRIRIRDWRQALVDEHEAEIAKKEAQNVRRASRGKSPLPVPSLDELYDTLDRFPQSDSEDASDSDPDFMAIDNPEARKGSQSTSRAVRKQREPTSRSSSGSPTRNDVSAVGEEGGPSARQSAKTGNRARLEGHSTQSQSSGFLPASASQKAKTPQEKQPAHTPANGSQPAAETRSIATRGKSTTSNRMRSSTARKPREPAKGRHDDPSDDLFSGNLFKSGNAARKRQTLDEAAKDPSKTPKLLKPRLRWILEKRSRDSEGLRDPLRPTPMSEGRNVAGTNAGSGNEHAGEKTSSAQRALDKTRSDSTDQTHGNESTQTGGAGLKEHIDQHASSPLPNDELFGDDLITHDEDVAMENTVDHTNTEQTPHPLGEQETAVSRSPPSPDLPSRVGAMEIDEDEGGLFVTDDEAEETDLRGTSLGLVLRTQSKSKPEANPEPTVTPETITKPCELGTSMPSSLVLMFELPSAGNGEDLQSKLRQAPLLRFTHQSTVNDVRFAESKSPVGLADWKRGKVSSLTDAENLSNVGKNLDLAGLVLICRLNDICVLLWSSCHSLRPCDELSIGDSGIQTLSYAVFRPTPVFDLRLMDAWSPESLQNHIRDQDLAVPRSPDDAISFDFSRLLPIENQSEREPSFFLLFPQDNTDESALLCRLLRLWNRECVLLSNYERCHWSYFRRLPHGAVIVHKDAECMLRLLPGLETLVGSRPGASEITFWTFDPYLMLSNAFATCPSVPDSMAEIGFRPLFPSGVMFLLCPSFLVSRPIEALTFLEWFSATFNDRTNRLLVRLVLCSEPDEWIIGLNLRGQPTAQDHRAVPDGAKLDDVANARVKCQKLIVRLMEMPLYAGNDPLVSPLLTSPMAIKANDEQSLVNWFADWATDYTHTFRRFVAVGTGTHDGNHLSARIRMPAFVPTKGHTPVGIPKTNTTNAPDKVALPPFNNVEAERVHRELDRLNREISRIDFCRAALFNKPVSYFGDSDMAFQFGDINATRCTSFTHWFNYFFPIDKIMGGKVQANTYIGFFHTIEDSWDPDMKAKGVIPDCRPWISIFRPANMQTRPWTGSELFIWDLQAQHLVASQDEIIYADQLIPAQQTLIEFVLRENRAKNPRQPLEAVWLGAIPMNTPRSSDPIAVTLDQIEALLRNMKKLLHVNQNKLPECGWKKVRPAGEKPQHMAEDEAMEEPPAEIAPEDMAVIYQAPPSLSSSGATGASKVSNRLFEMAQRARRDGQRGDFDYRFEPTTRWYEVQKAERRHHEHIKVADWRVVFREFGIGKGDASK